MLKTTSSRCGSVALTVTILAAACDHEAVAPPAPGTPLVASQSLLATARDHATAGDFDTAVGLLEQALEERPDDIQARAQLARALLKTGQSARAVTACSTGLALDSTTVDLYNTLAIAYAADGRYALAIEALAGALRQRPEYALGYVNLGRLHTKLGQYAAAEPYLEKSVSLTPENGLARRRLGELYLYDGRADEAVAEFTRALAADPQNETLHYLMGQAQADLGDLPAALESLKRAVELDPGLADAHYRIALLARRQRVSSLADSALSAFRRLQQIGGGDAEALKTLKKLRAAVLDSPEEPVYQYDLARFFAVHDLIPEALSRFQRVLQLRPRHYQAMNAIGSILLERKRAKEALTYFRAAVAIAPGFAPALMNAGSVYMILRQPGSAVEHFRRATEAAPTVPMTWFRLAQGHLAQDRPAAAEEALRQGMAQSVPHGQIAKAYADLLEVASAAMR